MSNAIQKSPWFQTSKFLNDVNDSVLGGAINSVPTGTQANAGIQDLPGDRIVLDDATATALSDTAVGTLHGGVYMYCLCTWTTQAAAVGAIAYFRAADIGSTTTTPYVAFGDAQPLTTVPTYILGVFINVMTKGNYAWVQVAGVASVLFDSTVSATTAGGTVIAKASASVASTADNLTSGFAVTSLTAGSIIGISVGAAATSTVSNVAITRGFWRI